MRALLASAVLLGLVASAQAQERVRYLVLVVDSSASIRPDEYETMKQGHIAALTDPFVNEDLADALVAVVEFATEAEVRVPFGPAEEVAAAYAETSRDISGSTALCAGMALAVGLVEGRGGRRVIDIAGDEPSNSGSYGDCRLAMSTALDEQIEINGLVLPYGGRTESTARFYGEYVVSGFMMVVETAEEVAASIKRKFRTEVASR